jgi:hypothetical protein
MRISRIISGILCLCIAQVIFAYTIDIPKKETLHVFGVGEGNGKLMYRKYDPYESYFPSCIVMRESGDFLISDESQGILWFDPSYNLTATTKLFASRLAVEMEKVIGWSPEGSGYSGFYSELGAEGFVKAQSFPQPEDESIGRMFFDFPFFFGLNVSDENIYVWKIENDRIKEVSVSSWLSESKSGFSKKDVYGIVSPKLGFLSYNAAIFFRSNSKPYLQPPDDNGKMDTLDYNNGQLFGIDSRGYRYYVVAKERLLIVDPKGNIVKVFKHREGLEKTTYTCFPSITANGDIYYLESRATGHRLIRIKRTW